MTVWWSELPDTHQVLVECWLPNSSATATTVDLRPLRCLTLPPFAVSRVPQDNILIPSSLQFLAALTSLSIPLVRQLGQSQVRMSRGKLSTTFRQLLQVLLEGKNLSI